MSAVLEKRGIPGAWDLVPLSDLGQWSGGGTPSKSKKQHWDGGTIPWVSPKDMKTLVIRDSEDHITEEAVAGSAAKLIPANSVLFVTRSGILRHSFPVAVNVVPVTVNQDLKALTPKEGVLPEYVAWALRAFSQDILNTCSKQGTTVNSIETNSLKAFTIPLAPLEQQKRIVAEIEKQFSRLDEAVANLKRVKANLKRYKAAVLKAAVEGKLTEEWRKAHPDVEPASQLIDRILAERRVKWEEAELVKMEAKGEVPKNDKWKAKYKEPLTPDAADLFDLPPYWEWVCLDSLLLRIEAGKSFKCEERPARDGEVGVLKVSAVTWGSYDEIESKTCTRGEYVNEDLFVRRGDFLFSRANTIDLVGACVIVDDVTKRIMLSDKILRFTFADDVAQWALFCLRSRWGRDEIERLATGNQESMRNIGQERIRRIRIPLPPTEEVWGIADAIDGLNSTSAATADSVDRNLERAKALGSAVLRDAFSGNMLGVNR